MGLLGAPIRLLDIENCEAFVQRTLDKSGIQYPTGEREELLSEGLTILFELASKYRPGAGGRDPANSRFSGYAAMFLPRRLGDAWHKAHPEHRYLTDPQTGQRGWSYTPPMISLDGLAAARNGWYTNEDHLRNAKTITAFCHATSKLRIPGLAASSIAR